MIWTVLSIFNGPQIPEHCISSAVDVACRDLSPDIRNVMFNTFARCSGYQQPVCISSNGTGVLRQQQVR